MQDGRLILYISVISVIMETVIFLKEWEAFMEVLYFLEKLRTPWLDTVMLTVTRLGEETALLVAALIVFWCVDKYKGYFLLGVGLLGNLANQFLKIACRVLRPWVYDPEFTAVEQAKAGAGGYSFPSGHSQTAVGTFGCIGITAKCGLTKALCLFFMVIVPFSRMYLGVHTPQDVLVGSLMALVMVFGLRPVMLGKQKKWIPIAFAGMLALSAGFLLYVQCWQFPQDLMQENYDAALKNAYTLIGSIGGVLAVYFLEEYYLHFSTKAVWWAQILKVVLGLIIVLGVKEGLRAPLELVFNGHLAARAVRYFLVVLVAGGLWPLSFRFFGKLGRKEN